MFKLVLLANAIWFGLAFHLFALRNVIFAKIVIPREQRDTPVFDVLAETGKFLGGFNLALCILNLVILFKSDLFPSDAQRIVLCLFFAIAHGTQYFYNLPIALDNKKGKGVWQVKGTMRFIFVTDFAMMVANLVVAAVYIWS